MYPPPASKGPNVAWMHRITPPLHSTSPLARKEEEEEDRDGSIGTELSGLAALVFMLMV